MSLFVQVQGELVAPNVGAHELDALVRLPIYNEVERVVCTALCQLVEQQVVGNILVGETDGHLVAVLAPSAIIHQLVVTSVNIHHSAHVALKLEVIFALIHRMVEFKICRAASDVFHLPGAEPDADVAVVVGAAAQPHQGQQRNEGMSQCFHFRPIVKFPV